MDLTKALERNFEALAAIIAALGAMLRAGIIGDGRITKVLRRAIQRVLFPAESAVRRLIVIAARGIVEPRIAAPWDPYVPWPRDPRSERVTRLAFPLFDTPKHHLLKPQKPQKSAPLAIPRVRGFGDPNLVPQPAAPPPPPVDPTIDARRVYWRLDALQKALGDIPGQARRLARLRARRAASKKPACISPLRPGYAPGRRKKHEHPVDEILAECQQLAHQALSDTS